MTEPLRAPQPRRSRMLHWAAWAAAVTSAVILGMVLFSEASTASKTLAYLDSALALGFIIEFFTRTGWREARGKYLLWHWFDLVAMVPIIWIDQYWHAAFLLWFVFVCRVIRATDRTLGDGFVQRHAFIVLSAFEEEITDKVLVNILDRFEHELSQARFGDAAAQAIAKNKDNLLRRIYDEQLKDGTTVAAIAQFTGLQTALERAERRMLESVIAILGSPETDQAISDILRDSMRRARDRIGNRSWKDQLKVAWKQAPA